MRNGGLAPLILNFSNRWRRLVSSKPPVFVAVNKPLMTSGELAGWNSQTVWTLWRRDQFLPFPRPFSLKQFKWHFGKLCSCIPTYENSTTIIWSLFLTFSMFQCLRKLMLTSHTPPPPLYGGMMYVSCHASQCVARKKIRSSVNWYKFSWIPRSINVVLVMTKLHEQNSRTKASVWYVIHLSLSLCLSVSLSLSLSLSPPMYLLAFLRELNVVRSLQN